MINCNECEEIFKVLSYMNKSEVMKIPIEILNFIKNNRNENFKTNIDRNDLFNLNNLSENSLDFLIYIDNIYWKDKQNLLNMHNMETFKFEKANEVDLTIINNKNVFQKILNKIKKLFYRKNNKY